MGFQKNLKIVKKWAKLRHPDPKFFVSAWYLYSHCTDKEKDKMIKEFKDYIKGVENGTIIPSVPKIPIRIFKK